MEKKPVDSLIQSWEEFAELGWYRINELMEYLDSAREVLPNLVEGLPKGDVKKLASMIGEAKEKAESMFKLLNSLYRALEEGGPINLHKEE